MTTYVTNMSTVSSPNGHRKYCSRVEKQVDTEADDETGPVTKNRLPCRRYVFLFPESDGRQDQLSAREGDRGRHAMKFRTFSTCHLAQLKPKGGRLTYSSLSQTAIH